MSELICHLEGKIQGESECGKTMLEMLASNEYDVIRNISWVNCPICLASPRFPELCAERMLEKINQ